MSERVISVDPGADSTAAVSVAIQDHLTASVIAIQVEVAARQLCAVPGARIIVDGLTPEMVDQLAVELHGTSTRVVLVGRPAELFRSVIVSIAGVPIHASGRRTATLEDLGPDDWGVRMAPVPPTEIVGTEELRAAVVEGSK